MQRNPSRMPRDSLVRPRGEHWRGWRPSILSLDFHSALCIEVHGGAKFGGALPQPFVCLADRTRPMWHDFRMNVRDHCQHFDNCLGLAIPMRGMDHCVAWLLQYLRASSKRTSPRERCWTRHFVKTSTKSRPAYDEKLVWDWCNTARRREAGAAGSPSRLSGLGRACAIRRCPRRARESARG